MIDPTAEIDPTAVIGPNVVVGPGVKVGAGARLQRCVIMEVSSSALISTRSPRNSKHGTRLPGFC
jgi:UDP-3-O-[3-hydroxymyristoyl] glucosamine N-acyltransferase